MRRPFNPKIWICILLVFVDLNCTYTQEGSVPFYNEPEVRVALLRDAKDFVFKVRGRYEIMNLQDDKIFLEDRVLESSLVTKRDKAICIEEQCYPTLRLRIIPSRDFSLMIQGRERRFRGNLDILADQSGGLLVVNRLGLEDYVRGVLPHEISYRWPLEAIMAQAVAARTYAMYQIRLNSAKTFDVTNDIYSQVYGGLTAERYRTNIAVERTRAQVLNYQGQILPAYFHATCGGHTEEAAALWKHERIQPLAGVPCRFCVLSPHYKWKKELTLKDIQGKLNENGFAIGPIETIAVLDRDPSSRIRELLLITGDRKQVTISGKDFRQKIGPNLVRSNNYRLSAEGGKVEFSGYGWGHGVGLCQWGALGMSRHGYDYQEILRYYYPGAELIKL